MNFLYRHRALLGALCLAAALLFTFGACFAALVHTAAQSVRLTVVLDAGHGGIDGGVTGTVTGKKESDINLAITRILGRQFEEAGFTVIETRPTEAGLYGAATPGFKKRDMARRAEIIRAASPAVVISIHQNFFSGRDRRGGQVFYREDLPSSRTLACLIQTALNDMPACARRSEPLAGDYFILNCSETPSVIVECGFLSNPDDEALLLDPAYREKLCAAVLSGTLSFLSMSAAKIG